MRLSLRGAFCLFVCYFCFLSVKIYGIKSLLFFVQFNHLPWTPLFTHVQACWQVCDGLVIDKATGCSKNRRYFLLLNNFTLSCYVKSVKKEQRG